MSEEIQNLQNDVDSHVELLKNMISGKIDLIFEMFEFEMQLKTKDSEKDELKDSKISDLKSTLEELEDKVKDLESKLESTRELELTSKDTECDLKIEKNNNKHLQELVVELTQKNKNLVNAYEKLSKDHNELLERFNAVDRMKLSGEMMKMFKDTPDVGVEFLKGKDT